MTPLPDINDVDFLEDLADRAVSGKEINESQGMKVLTDSRIEILDLLSAAFKVRKKYFARKVRVLVLNNAQNGWCAEDCNYCAQAANSKAEINKFPLKTDDEIMLGAKRAKESGAYRYCIVLSGRGPGADRISRMAALVGRIKAQYKIEVCLSAGFLDSEAAKTLKAAGLDRYNHNLNTSSGYYGKICSTHDYASRVETLETAGKAGLEVCSGIITGMGEAPEDLVEVAKKLRELKAKSIPINFYVHIEGNKLGPVNKLTPEYCLRTLCLFRFFNPEAEIRAAGGREANLGAMEALSLYPANSIFSEGYLNSPGHGNSKTLKMIKEAGFTVDSVEEV